MSWHHNNARTLHSVPIFIALSSVSIRSVEANKLFKLAKITPVYASFLFIVIPRPCPLAFLCTLLCRQSSNVTDPADVVADDEVPFTSRRSHLRSSSPSTIPRLPDALSAAKPQPGLHLHSIRSPKSNPARSISGYRTSIGSYNRLHASRGSTAPFSQRFPPAIWRPAAGSPPSHNTDLPVMPGGRISQRSTVGKPKPAQRADDPGRTGSNDVKMLSPHRGSHPAPRRRQLHPVHEQRIYCCGFHIHIASPADSNVAPAATCTVSRRAYPKRMSRANDATLTHTAAMLAPLATTARCCCTVCTIASENLFSGD